MSNTTNLDLERPDKGAPDWDTSLNSNMTKLDSGYGSNIASIADLSEVYIETGTFNYTSGDVITLPKAVDAVNEYSVGVIATSRAGDIGDIYVTKGLSSFTVYCSSSNTTDTFSAIIHYIGDVNSYGGTIYRRWYVSPDASITDHSDNSDAGSLAWVVAQIGASPATIEMPGNKTYTLTDDNVTIGSNIEIIVQMGAIFGGVKTLTFDNADQIKAGRQQIFGSSLIVVTTNGGMVYPEWWYSTGTWKAAFGEAIKSDRLIDLQPGKVYECSSNTNTNACTVSGENNWTLNGNGATMKYANGVNTGKIFHVDDCDDVMIQNVEFDGNIANGTEGHRQGLVFYAKNNLDIETAPCNRVKVKNCYIHDTKGDASESDATGMRFVHAFDVQVNNCTIENTDVNMEIRFVTRATISNCIMPAGGSSDGIVLWHGTDPPHQTVNNDITITGNVCGKQMIIAASNGVAISNNHVNNVFIGGSYIGETAFIASDVNFTGNYIDGGNINIGDINGSLTDITAKDIYISGNFWSLHTANTAINILYKAGGIHLKNNYVRLEHNCTGSIFNLKGTAYPPNVTVENNDIFLNGYTAPNFLNTTGYPLRVHGNYFVGSGCTVDEIDIESADCTEVYVTDNILTDGYLRIRNGPAALVRGNTDNQTGFRPIASAATITLDEPYIKDDSYFRITGSVGITSITASRDGHKVTLKFDAAPTLTDGSNLKLAGNFTASAGDTITLICDGTDWYEISRSAN